MKEVKIFDVPVEVFEDLLPETFEYLVAKFKEFVEDEMNSVTVEDYRDWRKYGTIEVILIDLKEIFKYINQKDASLLKQDIFNLLLQYKIKKGMGKKAYTLMIDERIAEAGKKNAADYGVTFDQYVQDLIEQDVSVEFLEEEEE